MMAIWAALRSLNWIPMWKGCGVTKPGYPAGISMFLKERKRVIHSHQAVHLAAWIGEALHSWRPDRCHHLTVRHLETLWRALHRTQCQVNDLLCSIMSAAHLSASMGCALKKLH